jgi:penicillin-binding protein 1C
MFYAVSRRLESSPVAGASHLRRTGALLLLLVAVLALAGCNSPAPLPAKLIHVPGAAVEQAVESQIGQYQADYKLRPQPKGTPQQIAEAYMRRFQPGTLPRVFQSSYVYDRNGTLLAEVFDEGRRTWVPLSRISPHLIDAMIATEDATFFLNDGVDTRRLLGALVQNTQSSDIVSGASTITMQLARMLFLPPKERFNRSLERKIDEALLAEDLTRLFSKDEILEMYMNLAYFGHLAYGPEAAARTYYGKTALELDLAEASLLAGMPQQPAYLDPFLNIDATKQRQRTVLDLMVRRGYITQGEADTAYARPIQLIPDPNLEPDKASHFVQYVLETLAAENYNLQRAGLAVYTTLDLDMHNLAQTIVREQVDALRPRFDLNNGALVALKPGTAEILVMVGSADYANKEIGGQVNVTLRQRQPGSAIKPVVYATAFEEDLVSPSTLLWDLRVKYPMAEKGKDYVPRNYDEKLRGPVTVRAALANSLNVPTVKLFDGIEPTTFISTAQSMGITSFNLDSFDRYGLAMALGGSEVSLLELASAYHTIANGGLFVPPTPILRALDGNGRQIKLKLLPEPRQAISPEAAFLVTDIISDNEARAPIFGTNSRLNLSRPAAAKTGTTTNFKDNWTVGFVKYLIAGVWAGNNDGRPMRNADGITGAGPIWNIFIESVLADPKMLQTLGAPEADAAWEFAPPDKVVRVARPCPAGVACRTDGDYFTQSWLDKTATAGPYSDLYLSGIMSMVVAEMAGGERISAGLCVRQPLSPTDPAARTSLVLPRGIGRLSMDWRDPEELRTLLTLTDTTNYSPTVLIDAAATPLLAMAQTTSAASGDKYVLTSNNRVRDEQKEVMRWGASRGEPLVLGDCDHAQDWALAVLGNGVRRVIISEPLAPRLASAINATPPTEEEQAEETPTPEAFAAAGGPSGIFSPNGTVSGVVPVQAAAVNPNFWKWQLDLLVNGQSATFLALGEQPVGTPSSLLALNTALFPNGSHTLRLRVVRRDGNYDEYYAPITIAN